MATFNIKSALDAYFIANWNMVTTPIQFQGTVIAPTTDTWLGLVYSPSYNDTYGLDGTATGRIEYMGNLKVFCYAKNATQAYVLADSVKTFLNGLQLTDIYLQIGQDGTATDMGNGYFECLASFPLQQFA